jgi:hypothetical protein
MPRKSKQQRRKEHKHPITPPQSQRKPLTWLTKKFWMAVVAASVLLTIIVSFKNLSPNVDVTTTQSLNLEDPLATPFLITNDSLLPIHSVEILFSINKIRSSRMNFEVENLSLGYAVPPIPILLRKEQKTFLCPPVFKFPSPIDSGDILISVTYRPSFVFWKKHQYIRFVTAKDSSGIARWYKKPLSE